MWVVVGVIVFTYGAKVNKRLKNSWVPLQRLKKPGFGPFTIKMLLKCFLCSYAIIQNQEILHCFSKSRTTATVDTHVFSVWMDGFDWSKGSFHVVASRVKNPVGQIIQLCLRNKTKKSRPTNQTPNIANSFLCHPEPKHSPSEQEHKVIKFSITRKVSKGDGCQ